MSIVSDARLLVKEDERLLRRIFPGTDAGNSEYYRWKYFENPHGEGVVIKKVDGAEVVARTGIVPEKIFCGARKTEQLIGWQVDSAVTEKYRDFRTFALCTGRSLQVAGERGYAGILAMPNKNSRDAVVRGFGFKKIFSFIPLLYVPFHMKKEGRFLYVLLCRSLIASLKVVRGLGSSKVKRSFSFEKGFRDMDEIQAFESDVIKDKSYIRWRYDSCPTRNYMSLSVSEGGRVFGNVLLRGRRIRGIDLLFVDDVFIRSEADLSKLEVGGVLAALSEHLHEPLVFFANNFETVKAFEKRGFFTVPKMIRGRDFEVVFYPLKRSLEGFSDDMRFSLGDIDVG